MTTPQPEPRPRRSIPLGELVGLLLLVIGVGAVATAAFFVDWRLGTAVLGAAATAVGFNLTMTGEE